MMNKDLKILQNKYVSNLFDWYKFLSKKTDEEKDSDILIFGDCDASLVRTLVNRVNSINIIFETNEYKRAFEYEKFNDKVKVEENIISEDKVLIIDKIFDYVLIPSTTEIIAKKGEGTLKGLISFLIKTYTNNEGAVIIAFDNKQGINVISGDKLEEGTKAYTYDEILDAKQNLLDEYKKGEFKIYFPMPEYKFPLRIYSEKYLPKLDDEDEKTRNLVSINKFYNFASSYIIIFKSDITSEEENIKNRKEINYDKCEVIYVKYNLNRSKRFAVKTMIILKDNEKLILKKALYEEANTHVHNMLERINLIDNKNIIMVKPIKFVSENDTVDKLSYVVFPFIKGEILSDEVINKIKNGASQKEIIEDYMLKLIGKNSGTLKVYNLDCLFSNAIINDNKIFVIDGEWIDDNTTEVKFLRFRILKYLYNARKQYLRGNSFLEFARDFSLDASDINRYEEVENEFQRMVHENINGLDIDVYNENKPDISRIYYYRAEYERIKEQLDRITGDSSDVDYNLNYKNEIIRLTNIHVSNLENLINIIKNENNELKKALDFFKHRESILFKILRKIKYIGIKIFPKETKRGKIAKYFYKTLRNPISMIKMIFTKSGRNRIYGDFMIGDAYFECGKVSFPKCENPKVSIIIPCFNQIRYTYRCLYTIMKNVNYEQIPYEVIIADDVSTDETKNINKYVDNIIVSRNEENLGFLKNCNKASLLAKGEYIYFLNNDTECKENFLSSLVKVMERDISCGLVGSKLIYSNGVLQEAGGIIWSDGTGANYGRNGNPNDYKYNYLREVDYISGASIMIRKSLWNDIGGFDERYAPAYSEDSDLCFEVRKKGYKVIYQPASEIIHFEGISNGVDENDTSSIKSYQVINNQKLKEKWENELINHYPSTNPNFYKARERNFNKKVILFIDHYVPTWDKDAGSKTTLSYIKMFIKKGYIVKFLGDNFDRFSPYGDVLQQFGVEVIYGGYDEKAKVFDYLKEIRKNVDFIYLNRPHIATKYIDFIKKEMSNCKVIYYGHDLHYLRLLREYEISFDEQTLYESKSFRSMEYSLLYKCNMNYYPSQIEVSEIKKIDENLKVKAISAYIYDKVDLLRIDFREKRDLLFVGGFSHVPNIDALKWYDEYIMPRIKARNPNIKLNIVGSNATEEVLEIVKKDGYNFLGYVSDDELLKLYKKVRIVIAPLRFGAGIKGKIVEAMSQGCSIVTTKCGSEGIIGAEYFMKVTETAADFAYEVINLYDNFDELERLSYESRKIINERFTMEAAWNIIKDDFV